MTCLGVAVVSESGQSGCFCFVSAQVVTCPNASFTDLAEIVSRIEPVKSTVVDGKSRGQLKVIYLLKLCGSDSPLLPVHPSYWLLVVFPFVLEFLIGNG